MTNPQVILNAVKACAASMNAIKNIFITPDFHLVNKIVIAILTYYDIDH